MDRPSYRQLQAFAKSMKLPGNMKYDVLWDLVHARKSGNERLVSHLLAEQKRLRVKRRIDKNVAKMKAESIGQYMPPENNNEAHLIFDGCSDRSTQEPPVENDQQITEEKMTVAHLLDRQRRHALLMSRNKAFRAAFLELPYRPPVYNQYGFYSAHPNDVPSGVTGPYTEPIKTNSYQDSGNRHNNQNPERKSAELKPQEPKKLSFQIEDIIAPSSSTTSYPQMYSNSYQMSCTSYADCLPSMPPSKETAAYVTTVGFPPEPQYDPWKKPFTDFVPPMERPLSSNGSHSLFIDTNQFSPITSETMSANEIGDDASITEFDTNMEAMEDVSLQPTYDSVNPLYMSTLTQPGLRDVDQLDQYGPVVEEITYTSNLLPPQETATVYFTSDPLHFDDKGKELTTEESQVYARLKLLRKSLGIKIETENSNCSSVAKTGPNVALEVEVISQESQDKSDNNESSELTRVET